MVTDITRIVDPVRATLGIDVAGRGDVGEPVFELLGTDGDRGGGVTQARKQ